MAPLTLHANRFAADRFAPLAGLQIGSATLPRIVSGWAIELLPTQGAYPLVAYQTVFLLQATFAAAAPIVYGNVPDPLHK